MSTSNQMIEILLVEDNPGDQQLTVEAFKGAKISNHLNVVSNGEEALRFLRNEAPYEDAVRPDLMLLDLNMPKMDGRELLSHIKQDDDLKSIPVVIMTTSSAEEDIQESYALHANCYITKPLNLDQFMTVVDAIEGFWLSIVKFPVATP